MDTEYEIKQKNKKTIFFLLVLGAFGFLCFKYAKANINIDISKVQASLTSASTCATSTVASDYDTSSPKLYNIADDGTVTDITSSVLAAETTSVNTCTTQNLSTSDSKCTKTTNTISVDGKSFIASDVTITLDKVVAPLVLLSGSSNNEIQDSNRNNTGIYKPAGEQYDEKQILVNSTPGKNNSEMKSEIDNAQVKTNFGTKYSIATSTTSDSLSSGDIVINKYISSDCKECNNVSNANPEKSNTESTTLTNVKFTLPSSTNTSSNASNSIEILNKCENYTNASFLSLNTTTCVNTVNIFWGTLSSLFPSHDWYSCDPKKDTNCVSAENLVIKMSPIFKETNAYMSYRNLIAMDPDSASKYKPVYVLTSCRALIQNKETGSVLEVGVKCVWDMSYLFYENEVSKYDDVPGSKSTLSTDAFIKYLENDSIARSSETFTSM